MEANLADKLRNNLFGRRTPYSALDVDGMADQCCNRSSRPENRQERHNAPL